MKHIMNFLIGFLKENRLLIPVGNIGTVQHGLTYTMIPIYGFTMGLMWACPILYPTRGRKSTGGGAGGKILWRVCCSFQFIFSHTEGTRFSNFHVISWVLIFFSDSLTTRFLYWMQLFSVLTD